MWYIKGNKSFLFFLKSQCYVLAWVYTQRRRLLRLFVNKIKCCPKRKTEDGLNRDKRWKGGKHNVPKANFSMSFQALKERGSWRGLNGYVKEESRIIMHRGDVKVAQECRCYYHWKASPETKAKTSPRGNLEKGKINWRVFFLSHFPCLSVKIEWRQSQKRWIDEGGLGRDFDLATSYRPSNSSIWLPIWISAFHFHLSIRRGRIPTTSFPFIVFLLPSISCEWWKEKETSPNAADCICAAITENLILIGSHVEVPRVCLNISSKERSDAKSSIVENEESIFDDGWSANNWDGGRCVILRDWQAMFPSSFFHCLILPFSPLKST